MTPTKLLVIGNSDGIGLALTRLLLADGHRVTGISRRPAPIDHGSYRHHVIDVTDAAYPERLGAIIAEQGPFPIAVYAVGVGNAAEDGWWRGEARVIEVNFVAAVRTLEVLLPAWLAAGEGHLVALSSLVDGLHVKDSASYCSSKAGLSTFLESTGLRLRGSGVAISNLRFGFVDTKMAKSPWKPFMISPERAAEIVRRVIAARPLRYSYPRRALALVLVLRWLTKPLLWTRRA